MRVYRSQLLPAWIDLGSWLYMIGALIPLVGLLGHASIQFAGFLGITCAYPPTSLEMLLLELLQIFFGITGFALLTGWWSGVRLGLICGYAGLAIRLIHDALNTSSLDAILQLDTVLRIWFIVSLSRLRLSWEKLRHSLVESLVYETAGQVTREWPARWGGRG